jgi:hypothetical protein
VVGVLLQTFAAVLVIYLPAQTTGASMVTMFAFGFFAGAGVLAYAIAAESMPEGRAGTTTALVSAAGFVLAGLFLVLPGRLLPLLPGLDDFGSALLIVPVLLAVAAVAGFFLRDTAPRGPAAQGAVAGAPGGAGPAPEEPRAAAPRAVAQDRPDPGAPGGEARRTPGTAGTTDTAGTPGAGREPEAREPGRRRGAWARRLLGSGHDGREDKRS